MDDFFAYLGYTGEIAVAHGIAHSIWSIYTDDFDRNLLEPHPYPRATVITYRSEPFYGQPSGDFSAEIKGPRWVDLWIAADDILGRCGDKHHVYIEDFTPTEDGRLSLFCGS